GVYPGTRTQVYQKLRLRRTDAASAAPEWYALLWYDAPAALVLYPTRLAAPAPEPLLSMTPPDDPLVFSARLRQKLDEQQLAADACFDCRYWLPRPRTNQDGVPIGRCTWSQNEQRTPDQAERMLRVQSG